MTYWMAQLLLKAGAVVVSMTTDVISGPPAPKYWGPDGLKLMMRVSQVKLGRLAVRLAVRPGTHCATAAQGAPPSHSTAKNACGGRRMHARRAVMPAAWRARVSERPRRRSERARARAVRAERSTGYTMNSVNVDTGFGTWANRIGERSEGTMMDNGSL